MTLILKNHISSVIGTGRDLAGAGERAATAALGTAGYIAGSVISEFTMGLGLAAVFGITVSLSADEKAKRIIYKGKGYTRPVGMNMASNIVSIMLSLSRYYFNNPCKIKPAAMLSGIPLGTVTELSHAMSDLVLKFRSAGGIFLAQQEGGDQSLRITGKAWGRNRYLFLTMLELLFIYGSATIVDLFKDHMSSALKVDSFIPKDMISENPWTEFNTNAVSEGRSEKHLTFPVITKNRVYNNMYIETYDWSESVEFGLNVIEYTIFLRKYLPEYSLKFIEVKPSEESKKKNSSWYCQADEGDWVTRGLRMIDTLTDIGFSASLLLYRTLLIVSGNSPEQNIALTFGINVNYQVLGSDGFEDLIKSRVETIKEMDSLSGLSTTNKEELMQVG